MPEQRPRDKVGTRLRVAWVYGWWVMQASGCARCALHLVLRLGVAEAHRRERSHLVPDPARRALPDGIAAALDTGGASQEPEEAQQCRHHLLGPV